MFIAVYDPTGKIFKSLQGNDLSWAQTMIEQDWPGDWLYVETDHLADSSREMMDISANPHAVVMLAPAPSQAELSIEVNRERSNRIEAGAVIDGIKVTGRDENARNLTNLALGAQLRLASGDTGTVTVFRDGDNVDHALNPIQVLSLWKQSAAYVSALYSASWALKAMTPIPNDYGNNAYWPEV